MSPQEITNALREMRQRLMGASNRIRRYTLDSRLRTPDKGSIMEPWLSIRTELDNSWTQWLSLRTEINGLPGAPTEQQCRETQSHMLDLERKLDLVQRELIAPSSTRDGIWTVVLLASTLIGSVYAYIALHGMVDFNVDKFEDWPDWGPVKYFEVASWAFFGVLCTLLYTAAYFLSRRDFDGHFAGWYISTAIRAPLLAMIVMLVVLEFVEWYGEGGWLEKYILEEGNKYYFIVFVSFCLGINSEATAEIIGDLQSGVTSGIRSVVRKVAQKFGAVVSDADIVGP